MISEWAIKDEKSVGKEVAAHLKQLEKKGLSDIITHKGRTIAWKLLLPASSITFIPSLESCRSWVSDRTLDFFRGGSEIPENAIPWIETVTRAIIVLESGNIKESIAIVRKSKKEIEGSIVLGAISELLEMKVSFRIGEEPEVGEFLELCGGPVGRALALRAEIVREAHPDSSDPPKVIQALRAAARRLESGTDINGLGVVYNYLGLTYRRNGDLIRAQGFLRRSIALLVASFDIPQLQTAIFNLGHTIYQIANNEVGCRQALRLMALDREIFNALGIGGDSAQAEIVAGTICLRLLELDAAERWLAQGRRITENVKSDYDHAGIERLAARIVWVRALLSNSLDSATRKEILERLSTAHAYFQRSGRVVHVVEQEIKAVKAGLLPESLMAKFNKIREALPQ